HRLVAQKLVPHPFRRHVEAVGVEMTHRLESRARPHGQKSIVYGRTGQEAPWTKPGCGDALKGLRRLCLENWLEMNVLFREAEKTCAPGGSRSASPSEK